METRYQQIDFIRLNEGRIAGCAWNGFQQKGRGMVLVPSDRENESLRMCPFDFMPETDAATLLKPWAGAREAGMVNDYNPNIEVVICFVPKADGNRTEVDNYRLKTRPTRPAAAVKE